MAEERPSTATPLPDLAANALMSIQPRYNSFHQHNGIPHMPNSLGASYQNPTGGNAAGAGAAAATGGYTGNPGLGAISSVVQPTPTSVINLSNSTDVVIGPMTQYQGSVTIYQYMDATVEATRNASGRSNQNRGGIPSADGSNLRQERYFIYGVFLFFTIVGFSAAIYFVAQHIQNSAPPVTQDILFGNNYESRTIPNLGNGHLVIDRNNWGAQDSARGSYLLDHPIPYVLVTHIGVQSVPCYDVYKCSIKMRSIQDAAIAEKGETDITNNFYLGGDGNIYVGRGWDIANAYANKTLAVCFMGDYIRYEPNDVQFSALQHLLTYGVVKDLLAKDFKIVAHNQTKITKSPGPYVYGRISKYARWSPCGTENYQHCGAEIGLPMVWKQEAAKKS